VGTLFNFVLIFLAEYIVFDTNKKTLWRYLNKLSSLRKWFAFGVLSTALIQQSIFLRPVKRWCTWFIKHTKECVFNFTRLLVGFTKFPFISLISFLNIGLIDNNVKQSYKSNFLILKNSTYNFVLHYYQLNLYSKMKFYRILINATRYHRLADDEAIELNLLVKKQSQFSLIN